jgi:hypothetical protein
MAPSAPFHPPPADGPGKVHIDNWVPPPVTKQVDNFAQLSTIDLSLMDSDDPAVVHKLEQQIKTAIREDGFLFLENYGVDIDQVYSPIVWGDICSRGSFIDSLVWPNTCTAI